MPSVPKEKNSSLWSALWKNTFGPIFGPFFLLSSLILFVLRISAWSLAMRLASSVWFSASPFLSGRGGDRPKLLLDHSVKCKRYSVLLDLRLRKIVQSTTPMGIKIPLLV